jgi:hypothetical protein
MDSMKTYFALISALALTLCGSLQAQMPVDITGQAYALLGNMQNKMIETVKNTGILKDQTEVIKKIAEGQQSIAFRMSQMTSLTKYGVLLSQSPNGGLVKTPMTGLSFDGKNFVGGNFDFIDNIVGMNGTPIAMDRQVPQFMQAVKGDTLANFQQRASVFSTPAMQNLVRTTAGILMGQAGSKLGSMGGVVQTGVDQITRGMIGDGIFIRDYAGVADDAFYNYVVRGTPSQAMSFYSSPLYQAGQKLYDPVRGIIDSSTGSQARVDMSNILSSGAYQAIDAWRSSQIAAGKDVGKNPYDLYAMQLLPDITNLIKSTKPGEPIVITPDLVEKAKRRDSSLDSTIPTESTKMPSLAASSSSSTAKKNDFGVQTPSGTTSDPIGTLVAQPAAADAEQYQSTISASDQRLSEIQKQINYNRKMQDYTRQLSDAMNEVIQEATQIQKSMTPENAIPEITQFVLEAQKAVTELQHQIAKYDNKIDDLKAQRYALVKERGEYVAGFTSSQAAIADHRVSTMALSAK